MRSCGESGAIQSSPFPEDAKQAAGRKGLFENTVLRRNANANSSKDKFDEARTP